MVEVKRSGVQELIGKVISDKMEKTVVVAVERTYRHPRLGKTLRAVKRYKAHYEGSEVAVGDIVSICEGRPVSKTKYMYVTGIITKQPAGASHQIFEKQA